MTALPKSTAAATKLLERYADLDARLAKVEADRSDAIAAANYRADIAADPMRQERDKIGASIESWWSHASATIANGRKSVELGGCMIGTRMSRPSLGHTYESDDKAVEALRKTRYFKQATKVKFSLDRTATAKLLQLGGKAGEQVAALGFRIEQADNFFVERVTQAGTITP